MAEMEKKGEAAQAEAIQEEKGLLDKIIDESRMVKD